MLYYTLNHLLLSDSQDFSAYLGRAKCYYALGNYQLTLTDLEQAIKLDSGSAEYYKLRSEVRLLLGQCSEAESDLKKSLKLSEK